MYSRSKMKMNGVGCVFQYYGKVPETIYSPTSGFRSPVEEAVFNNCPGKIGNLVSEGHAIDAGLKIGEMSCLEFASMMGFDETLKSLIKESRHFNILKKYFQTDDVVDRAYIISGNKDIFFGENGALAEANRYEAALYTAVEYNQPRCVATMLEYLGVKEPNKHNFIAEGTSKQNLSALDLAELRGHNECKKILENKQWLPAQTRNFRRTTSHCDRME